MILENHSKNLSKHYADASQLPLRLFCEIINTGDTGLLKRDPCKENAFTADLWGDIIIEYGEIDGNNKLSDTLEKQKQLFRLKNSYTTIKAMVRLLMCCSPSHEKYGSDAIETILDLERMGYKIDTTDSETYSRTILACDKKANSLITYIKLKSNELKGDDETEEKGVDFDELMAMLASHFKVDDDISLKRYCKLKKIITNKMKK